MNITVESRQLLQAVDMLRKVIASKPILPILDCILLEQHEPDSLLLTASDSEHRLSVVCPVSEITGFHPICLPAVYLAEALRTIPDQPVTIEAGKMMNVTVRHANGEVSFMAQPADEFPGAAPADNAESVVTLPLDRLMGLCRTVPGFAANDELRPVLNGALLEVGPQGLVCVASDGHRLIKVVLTDITATERHSILLPRRSYSLLQQWQKRGCAPVSVTLAGNECLFTTDGLRLSCRLIEGRYPNYNSVIPQYNDKHVTVDREQLLRAVDSVSAFSSRASQLISLRADGSQLRLKADNPDFSTRAHVDLSAATNFDTPLRIGFHAGYLSTLLSQLPCSEVKLELHDPTSACVVHHDDPAASTSITALLMPMQLLN